MGKHHLDDGAEQILLKWRRRIGQEWEPSPSDVLRYLDSRIMDLERDAGAKSSRRITSRA